MLFCKGKILSCETQRFRRSMSCACLIILEGPWKGDSDNITCIWVPSFFDNEPLMMYHGSTLPVTLVSPKAARDSFDYHGSTSNRFCQQGTHLRKGGRRSLGGIVMSSLRWHARKRIGKFWLLNRHRIRIQWLTNDQNLKLQSLKNMVSHLTVSFWGHKRILCSSKPHLFCKNPFQL